MRSVGFLALLGLACAGAPESTPPRCNDLPLSGAITVLGQVNSPGIVAWRCGMRVHDAVHSAGGFNQLASPRKTRVQHAYGRVETGESLYLLPGDVVTAHAVCDGY